MLIKLSLTHHLLVSNLLAGFRAYFFAQSYPRFIAHGIVYIGLKRPAAKRLLLSKRIAFAVLELVCSGVSSHMSLYHKYSLSYTFSFAALLF